MASIRQHIPNFVSGVDPQEAEFVTLDELLRIPFVEKFSGWVISHEPFYRYSRSEKMVDRRRPEPVDYYLLMAEYLEGKKWWVIGYITGWDEIADALPEWAAPPKPAT